jgi:hypothetical protein
MTLGRETLIRLATITLNIFLFYLVVELSVAIFILLGHLIVIMPNANMLSGITTNVIVMSAILVNGVAPNLHLN